MKFRLIILVLTVFLLSLTSGFSQKEKQITLVNDEALNVVLFDTTRLLIAKQGETVNVVLFDAGKEMFGLEVTKNGLKTQTTKVRNLDRSIVFDDNGDGIPEKRLIIGDDGNIKKVELFYEGTFKEALLKKPDWFIGEHIVIYKNGLWIRK